MPKKSKQLLLVLFLPVLLIGLVAAIYFNTVDRYEYEDLHDFSVEWKSCPDEDRYKMVGWLLDAEPQRHTIYPVNQTRLDGLSRSEVIQYLGKGNSDGTHYYLGTIEDDFLGNLFVPKTDHLIIDYDANDIVSHVETIS